MIKLLIVDDSALVRKLLTGIFNAQPDFEVRQARDGVEALGMLGDYAPDVITLDVHMPRMDGLTCLDRIMIEHPCPVVMVSSLTADSADATLEALHLGAGLPREDTLMNEADAAIRKPAAVFCYRQGR